MQSLMHVSERRLPADVRALFDPDRPLPEGVILIPSAEQISGAHLITFWLLGLPVAVLGLFLAFGPIYWLITGSVENSNQLIGGSFIGVGGAVTAWYLLRWGAGMHQRRRERAAGRWRYGIFLTPDWLVARNSRGCTLLHRAGIREIRTEKHGFSHHRVLDAVVRYQPHGDSHERVINLGSDYEEAEEVRFRILQRWLVG